MLSRNGDGKGTEGQFDLPRAYYLDDSDPDIVLLLRRRDNTFVAAFSASGATRESIVDAAMKDYRYSSSARKPISSA